MSSYFVNIFNSILGNRLLNSNIMLVQLWQAGNSVKRLILPDILGSFILEAISSNIFASVSLYLGNPSSTYVSKNLFSRVNEKLSTLAPLLARL